MARSNSRRQSTIAKKPSFAEDHAKRLIRRVEGRLRRSAQNRSQRKYGKAYRIAAGLVHDLIAK